MCSAALVRLGLVDRRLAQRAGLGLVHHGSHGSMACIHGSLCSMDPMESMNSMEPWVPSWSPWIRGFHGIRRSMDSMDPWICERMATKDSWIHGYMDSWMLGFIDPRIPWIHGPLDSWTMDA